MKFCPIFHDLFSLTLLLRCGWGILDKVGGAWLWNTQLLLSFTDLWFLGGHLNLLSEHEGGVRATAALKNPSQPSPGARSALPLTCLWSGTDCTHTAGLILNTRNLYKLLITKNLACWCSSHTIQITCSLLCSFTERCAEAWPTPQVSRRGKAPRSRGQPSEQGGIASAASPPRSQPRGITKTNWGWQGGQRLMTCGVCCLQSGLRCCVGREEAGRAAWLCFSAAFCFCPEHRKVWMHPPALTKVMVGINI